MSGAWRLAAHYVWYHRARSITLILCVSLVAFLPLAVAWLTSAFQKEIQTRTEGTPLLIGRKGSRYDLVLESLYFEGRGIDTIPARQWHRVEETDLAQAIPLYVKHRAKGFPVVGTSLDYFPFRKHTIAAGKSLERLGDAVAGAQVARELNLKPGDFVLTDAESVFDIAGQTPLRMRIVGILAPTDSPDDRAFLVDIPTAWIIDGIGHGHDDVAQADPALLLKKEDRKITASAGVVSYTEITDANIDSFHFHGEPDAFPLSSIIVAPRDDKSASLLQGMYVAPEETMQIVRPAEVMGELLRFVFRAKQFFDAQSLIVAGAMLALLGLILALSVRLRQRETETLFKMGCARGMIVQLFVAEWVILLAASGIVVLAAFTLLLPAFAPWVRQLLLSR